MKFMETHTEITNTIARDLTGIKSENTMKNVFLRLKSRNMLEPIPERKGPASAWRMPDPEKTTNERHEGMDDIGEV